jgi:hypothetical protein
MIAATGFNLCSLKTIATVSDTSGIPGSTITHSPPGLSAMIQQLVANIGAAKEVMNTVISLQLRLFMELATREISPRSWVQGTFYLHQAA